MNVTVGTNRLVNGLLVNIAIVPECDCCVWFTVCQGTGKVTEERSNQLITSMVDHISGCIELCKSMLAVTEKPSPSVAVWLWNFLRWHDNHCLCELWFRAFRGSMEMIPVWQMSRCGSECTKICPAWTASGGQKSGWWCAFLFWLRTSVSLQLTEKTLPLSRAQTDIAKIHKEDTVSLFAPIMDGCTIYVCSHTESEGHWEFLRCKWIVCLFASIMDGCTMFAVTQNLEVIESFWGGTELSVPQWTLQKSLTPSFLICIGIDFWKCFGPQMAFLAWPTQLVLCMRWMPCAPQKQQIIVIFNMHWHWFYQVFWPINGVPGWSLTSLWGGNVQCKWLKLTQTINDWSFTKFLMNSLSTT